MPNPLYDVVIVGAGSVGVPAAWAMARSGLKVLVLDRFASPGQGSNKTAIGGIRATHSEPAKIRACLRSLEIASTWQETYGDDIEWRTGGYSFVAYDEPEVEILKGLLETQQANGLSINWHSADDLLAIVPALNPDRLLGGTFGQVLFSLAPSPIIEGFDCRETSGFLPMVSRRMICLVPRLAGLRVRRTWRGLYPMSPDGAPLVGRSSEIEGYVMAIGLCGHGLMLGPGLGELLDRVVRDDLTDEDRMILDGLSPYRSFEGQATLK